MCDINEVVCSTCFRNCHLKEGDVGFCRARVNDGGKIIAKNYGSVTSLALDPIEKKPLAAFMPGSYVLSLGSYACNLRCPFCQNYAISQASENDVDFQLMSPKEIVEIAIRAKSRGNIGVAFTYNEPLVGWEFVRDVAMLVHQYGMKNVLVTNGCVETETLNKVLPFIDAMNVDLKCFTNDGYKKLGGDLEMVKNFIVAAAAKCHVEITTLIVPGLNDNENEIDLLAKWIAENVGKEIVLHITRFFPRWKMTDALPTNVKTVYDLADVARRHLTNVIEGNV